MLHYIQNFIKDFYDRNLFERIILYIFIAELLVKVFVELVLGKQGFFASQERQYVFFALLALDYAVSYRRIIDIKVTINSISIFALTILVMVLHGLFVGIVNHNAPFIIFNDTVPLLMLALNVLRMQSMTEMRKPIDIQFLFKSGIIIAAAVTFFGILAGDISIPNTAIFYPLMLACIFKLRPFPKWAMVLLLFVLALNIGNINRTSMAFVLMCVSGYIGIQTLHNPAKSTLIFISIIVMSFVAWSFVPTDSRTYARITNITTMDFNATTGSIGERQLEQHLVQEKIKQMGKTAEWTGLGFGGVYDMQFTHYFKPDYGHAHYGWVWFNLRFGKIGYFYLGILVFALLFSATHSFRSKDEAGLFVALMCISAFIYIFTFVNSIWLLSGLHFLYRPDIQTKALEQEKEHSDE